MDYPDYFSLQAAKHDMTGADMVKLHDDFLRDLRPLYLQLHTWAKYELAKKYGQPVPERIPAHWIPTGGPGVERDGAGAGLDAAMKAHTAEWVVRTAEAFYTSMGRPPLSASFWEKSDLYPVPPPSRGRRTPMPRAGTWIWRAISGPS